MEPFEDFEFKPLTDGLGFHKKAEKLKTEPSVMRAAFDDEEDFNTEVGLPADAPRASSTRSFLSESNTAPASQSISDLINSLPPSLDFISSPKKSENNISLDKSAKDAAPISRPQIFQPLAREDYKLSMTPPVPSSSGPTIGQVLPTPGTKAVMSTSVLMPTPAAMKAPQPASPYRERLDESFARAFPHADRKGEKRKAVTPVKTAAALEPIPAHFGAAILDGMVVTGMSTLLLVCILAITHVNLMGLLNNAETDGPTRIHLALLLIAVQQLYMLTARSFFQVSLGEWAFELQLGTKEQHESTLYPLRVGARTLLVTFTGLFLLPALSLALGKDLAAKVTGVQLYRQNEN